MNTDIYTWPGTKWNQWTGLDWTENETDQGKSIWVLSFWVEGLALCYCWKIQIVLLMK